MPQYEVIRGTDNEIEFAGLKGRYVYYLFGGLAGVVLMGLLFFCCYLTLHLLVC